MKILAGTLTGITASMGLGGGFILLIYLTLFAGISQRAAGGINLLFFLPISIISVIIHNKNRLIEWEVLPPLCIAGAAGVALGNIVMSFFPVSDDILKKTFAVLLIFFGVIEFFGGVKVDKNEKK